MAGTPAEQALAAHEAEEQARREETDEVRRRNRERALKLADDAGMPRAARSGLWNVSAGYILGVVRIERHDTDLRQYGGKVKTSWLVWVGASEELYILGPRGGVRWK